MAFVILKNDNGNIEVLGPYDDEVPEEDYIMRHGLLVELKPHAKCAAVINTQTLNDLIQAAHELIALVCNDESRFEAWKEEIDNLLDLVEIVTRDAQYYFNEDIPF